MYIKADFPITIPGLLCWLKSSVPGSVVTSGSNVTQWTDISGRGYHFIQPTGGKQPTFDNNSILFNGSSNYLYNEDIRNLLSHEGPNYTIFLVFKTNNYTLTQTLLCNTIDGYQDEIMVQLNGSKIRSAFWTHTDLDYVESEPFTSNDINSLTVIHEYTTLNLDSYLNYHQINSGTDVPTVSTTGNMLSLGASPNESNYLNGRLYEFIVYDSHFDSTNRVNMQRYLSNEYGSPAS
jgi:hypothetical protein